MVASSYDGGLQTGAAGWSTPNRAIERLFGALAPVTCYRGGLNITKGYGASRNPLK